MCMTYILQITQKGKSPGTYFTNQTFQPKNFYFYFLLDQIARIDIPFLLANRKKKLS